MATLQVCIFDRTGGPQLRAELEALRGVEVVSECSDWEAMQSALRMHRVQAAVLMLDREEIASGFLLTQRVAELAPHAKIVGVSDDQDPETIIKAMRAGCSQFVRLPIDADDLKAALDRSRSADSGMIKSQRICLMGASGGAGTTTIACNLAIELANITDRPVALLDLNLEFADVACHFDCTPKCGVADICRHGVDLDATLLQGALHTHPSRVALLSKPAFPTEAAQVESEAVSRMLQVAGEMFPYVVVDLPRVFTPATLAALGEADRVLLITQLAVPFLRNATRIYEHLLHLGANEERIEIVVNRSNASFEMITPDEVNEHFGRPIFANIPNDYRRMTAARDLGSTLLYDAPNSPARLGIYHLAMALHGDVAPEPAAVAAGGSSGLLKRLWSFGSKTKAKA